jgi:hypothetical protein
METSGSRGTRRPRRAKELTAQSYQMPSASQAQRRTPNPMGTRSVTRGGRTGDRVLGPARILLQTCVAATLLSEAWSRRC